MSLIEYPKTLYHYTTVETLALILKNKKLRFTRADKVNDLEEVIVTDFPELKKTVFISCWTASKNESIPLWALYASKAKGVRIKLAVNMFKRGTEPYKSIDGRCHVVNLFSLENVLQRGEVYQWLPYLFGPYEVKYLPNSAVSILEDDEFRVERIGTVKLEHWKFEQEYRFLIVPDVLWNSQLREFKLNREFLSMPPKQTYIDIPLDKSILDTIEITLGPSATKSEKCIVETLLQQYTGNVNVKNSRFKDRVRLN